MLCLIHRTQWQRLKRRHAILKQKSPEKHGPLNEGLPDITKGSLRYLASLKQARQSPWNLLGLHRWERSQKPCLHLQMMKFWTGRGQRTIVTYIIRCTFSPSTEGNTYASLFQHLPINLIKTCILCGAAIFWWPSVSYQHTQNISLRQKLL